MNRQQHRVISVLLAFALLLGLAMPAMAADHPFTDVREGAWYAEAVQFVYEHDIMGGVGGNRFDPQGSLTRAAVAALLFRAHNGREATAEDDRSNNFDDVGNSWYAPYVTWAFNNGIVQGMSATIFNPHGNISRQEFAVMVYRYAMNLTVLFDRNISSGQWTQFTDRDQIATWAYSALRWMNVQGILTGSPSATINPTDTATRAEAAVMMMRLVRENERLSAPFVLTISVEETSLPQGESFRAHVELQNNSGEDVEITYGFLFQPLIPNWHLFDEIDRPPSGQPRSRFFEANSIIKNIGFWGDEVWRIGTTLEVGTHELRFNATFYLNWEQENQQEISIWSNPIVLTVQ